MSKPSGVSNPVRGIIALSIVVGCFAVLWPKIFYPMLQTALRGSQDSGYNDYDDGYDSSNTWSSDPKIQSMVNGIRSKATGHRKMQRSIRSPINPSVQNQSGNVLGFFMPFYSIAIVLFFVYTMMKYLSRNKVSENVDANFMSNLEKHRETLANLTERLKNIRTKNGPTRNGKEALDRSKVNNNSDYNKDQVPIRGSSGDNQSDSRKDSRKELSEAIKILLADLMELREFAYAIEEHAVHEQSEWQRQLKRCQFRCQDANHNANLHDYCGMRGKHPEEAKNVEKKILRTNGTDEDVAEDQEYESDMENDGREEPETSNMEEIFEDKNEEYSVSESYSRDDNEIDYTDEDSYYDEGSREEEYEDGYEEEYEEEEEEEYEEERIPTNHSDNCDPSHGPINIFRRKSKIIDSNENNNINEAQDLKRL